MVLAANERASNQVRAIASWEIDKLKKWIEGQRRLPADVNRRAFLYYSLDQIKRFQDDPKKMNLTPPQAPPDGQPIGMLMDSPRETETCACAYLRCFR
jgi:hypothetical protein